MSNPNHFAFADNGGKPLLFGHQGAPDIAGPSTGDTMASFEAAVNDANVDVLELDIFCTLDEVIMVNHGSANEREVWESGLPLREYLESRTAAQIEAEYPGTPRLDEVFDAFPDTRVNIDVETDRSAHNLYLPVRRARATDRINIAAFDSRRVQAAAEPLGGPDHVSTSGGKREGYALLAGGRIAKEVLTRTRAARLQLPHEVSKANGRVKLQVSADMVKQANEHGAQVDVWTPDEGHQIERALVEAEVDGVITNSTKLASEIMVRHGLR